MKTWELTKKVKDSESCNTLLGKKVKEDIMEKYLTFMDSNI